MNETVIKILQSAIKENLSKEEFLDEFKKDSSDFCALRVGEFKHFAELLVIECSKFSDRPDELRQHFGLK